MWCLCLQVYLLILRIISLLDLCLNATYMQFQNVVYQQVHGTSMGSPVSITIANLVMEDIEQRALSTFRTLYRSGRDMLMILALLSSPAKLKSFTNILTVSSHQSNLRTKLNRTINFHSSTFSSTDKTTVPYWPLFSGNQLTRISIYLHFNSHHPQSHKQSVVHKLFSSAESLFSCPSLKSIEELHVSKALQDNGYLFTLVVSQDHVQLIHQKQKGLLPSLFHTWKDHQKLSEGYYNP